MIALHSFSVNDFPMEVGRLFPYGLSASIGRLCAILSYGKIKQSEMENDTMNDRILFRSDSLTEAASELNKLIDTLEDIAGDLNRLDTSAEWWSKVSVSTSHGKNNALITVSMLKSDFGKTREYVSSVSGGVRKAQELFNKADSDISKSAESMFSGSSYDLSANDPDDIKNEKETDEKKSWWDYFFQYSLIPKLVGTAGIFGAILKIGLTPGAKWFDSGVFGYGDSVGEAVVNFTKDTVSAIGKIYEWLADDEKGFKDFFGLNMKTEVSGIFDKFTEGGATEAFAWLGLGLNLVSNGIGNYQEMQSGEIDAKRAVQETFVETAVDFGVDWAITAGLTGIAVATVGGAPAILIGVGAVGVKAVLDAGAKWLTNGEKDFTEAVSDFIIDSAEVASNITHSVSSVFLRMLSPFGAITS